MDIENYKAESFTISKGIHDALWVVSATIDKHDVPEFFVQLHASAVDHQNIQYNRFVGIIPAVDLTLAPAEDKASVIGYDYAWYLTVQYVPSDERITEEGTNPSDTITSLLGGSAWDSVSGVEPHRINSVADWDNIKKAFEFGVRCTRWKAIQEICDYCNFVFEVKWRYVSGTWRPSAYFVHEDDIDSSTSGLDIPDAVMITAPDPHLLNQISVNDSPAHQYNKVLVTGYDIDSDLHFYASAQTVGVSDGTEIAIEYVHADAALTTQAKADERSQELLDFFQEPAKIYNAQFKRRMDLELYQKISFAGYSKIDQDVMRITRITYSRSAANDIVEIEFSKDQAIQQLRRLDRAVHPDYVAGTRDMINNDLSDVGLIDVFDDPVASGTAAADLWELSGFVLRPTDAVMDDITTAGGMDIRGLSLDTVSGIRGRKGLEFAMWGGAGSQEEEGYMEFMRWHNYESGVAANQYLEISSDVLINNNAPYPKLYFDINSSRPTYLQAYSGSSLKSFEMIVGNNLMLRLTNYADTTPDFVGCYENLLLTKDIIAGGRIEGDGNNNLVFWDNATGQKTLSQLAAGTSNADTVDGWHIQHLYSSQSTVCANCGYYWWWTFPYSGTEMSVIPAVRADLGGEIGWYPGITVYVLQQDFGSHGVYIMVHNGSSNSVRLSVEAIVMWY